MGASHVRMALQRQPSEVRKARSQVRRACTELSAEVRETAELLTSELFSNALRHGTGPIMLNVSVGEASVRVEVSDKSPQDPVVGNPGPEDTHGRGMVLVEALADEWGVARFPSSAGKFVWFALVTAA